MQGVSLGSQMKNNAKRIVCVGIVFGFSLFTAGCADVNVPDARNANIPAPVTAEERRQAVNERPDSVMYLPLGEDVLVPSVLTGGTLPDDRVGPFELRGETVAGALQLVLADYDVSLAFETEEGLTRRITVANLKGDLDKVVERVCSLADLYCSFEDGVVVVKDSQIFTVTLPPIGVDGDTGFINDVITGLTAVLGGRSGVGGRSGLGGSVASAGRGVSGGISGSSLSTQAPVSDPTTRSIVYRATQRSSKLAENYFQRLRANTALIVFETYIWEVSLSADNTSGINWSDFATIGKFNFSAAVAGSAVGATNPVSIGLPTTNLIGEDANPTEVFEFLSTFGAVKTISQPQISVLSGSSAELRVADTENYVSEITTTLDQGQSTTAVSTDSVDSGFTLSIASSWDKSTVYADVDISLENVNSITPFTFSDGGATGTSTTIQLPDTSERELNTQVRIRPGDSLLIGGLVRENDDFDSRGVGLMEPLLPDSRSAGANNLELVFMMRPRVVVYTSGEDQRYKGYLDAKKQEVFVESAARSDWLKSNQERPYKTTREAPVQSSSPSSKTTYNSETQYEPVIKVPTQKNEAKAEPVVVEPDLVVKPVDEPESIIEPEVVAVPEEPEIITPVEDVVEAPVMPKVSEDVVDKYSMPSEDGLVVPVAPEVVTEPAVSNIDLFADQPSQTAVEKADEYVPSPLLEDVTPKGRVSKSINDFSDVYVPSQSGSRISRGSVEGAKRSLDGAAQDVIDNYSSGYESGFIAESDNENKE
ncbi:MAG: hypothetical protein CMH31_02740 [Micavibrio sp.]|nr:hypothetical protein [Micavibrio sp.]